MCFHEPFLGRLSAVAESLLSFWPIVTLFAPSLSKNLVLPGGGNMI